MRSKVTIVGAGNTGATMAQILASRGYADVMLIDIVEGLPQGKALDIAEGLPWVGSSSSVGGTNDWAATKTKLLKPLKLTKKEKADLLAFLDSLSGPRITIEEPELPEYAPLPAPASN